MGVTIQLVVDFRALLHTELSEAATATVSRDGKPFPDVKSYLGDQR